MKYNIEIIVGTYEEFLLGYKIEHSTKENNELALIQTIASRDHTASVRCVSSDKKFIASGGSDDKVIIYDMEKRSLIQMLMIHNGTINTLAFSPDGSHLLTGSDDGSICITRTGSWVKEKCWAAAHKSKSVTHLAIHPTGKLALSIGGDNTLRTWNLIKGRQAYATNLNSKESLGKCIECVEWSPDGKTFLVTGAKVVEVWSVESASVLRDIKCEAKPTSVCWYNKTELYIGLENGNIMICSLKNDVINVLNISDKRVKGICCKNKLLGTISSTGDLAIWKIKKNKSIELLCKTNIGCRPTCVTMLEISDSKQLNEAFEDSNIQETKIKENVNKSTGRVIIEMEESEDRINKEDNIKPEIQLENRASQSKKKKRNESVKTPKPDSDKKSKTEKREFSLLAELDESTPVKKRAAVKIERVSILPTKKNKSSPKKISTTLPLREEKILTSKSAKKSKRKNSI